VVSADSADTTFPKLTEAQTDRFHEVLNILGAQLALAGISFYRFTRLGEVENRRRKPRKRTEQFHAELLQAIAVARPRTWHHATARRADIDELESLLALLPNSFRTVQQHGDARDSDELAEMMRGQTQYVRNWAHPRQLLKLLRELFTPLDSQYRASMGVGLTSLVDLIEMIAKALDERSQHFVSWHNALTSAEPHAWPAIAREFWPEHNATATEASTARSRMEFDLVLHSPLSEVFTWSLEELAALIGLAEPRRLLPVLQAWSIRPSEQGDSDLRHTMLDNPVWSHPFVQLLDDRFFLPFPGLLFSFGLELIESASKLHVPTYRRYIDKKWRGRFLEAALDRLLQGSFPGVDVNMDNLYPGGQNDFSLRVGDFMLVVEAKSARVPQAARRGGIASMRRAITDIVFDGSEQAYRFIDFLRAAQRLDQPAKLSDGRTIDVAGVAEFIPCVVHLDPMGLVTADTKRISRIFGRDADGRLPALAVALADLESVFEVLDSPEQRLHYLYRRRQLELHHAYLADELDLLATYFDNQLNFDERTSGGELLLYGRSTPIDRWLSADQELTPVPKPKRRMTERFKTAIDRASRLDHPGRMRLALVLQDVFDENQRDLEHQLRLTVKALRRGRSDHRVGMIEQALTEGRLAFAFVAYTTSSRDDAREVVTTRLDSLLDSGEYTEVLVLGINLEAGSEPYELAAAGSRLWGPSDAREAGVVLG
jgi:hypothetical protein